MINIYILYVFFETAWVDIICTNHPDGKKQQILLAGLEQNCLLGQNSQKGGNDGISIHVI